MAWTWFLLLWLVAAVGVALYVSRFLHNTALPTAGTAPARDQPLVEKPAEPGPGLLPEPPEVRSDTIGPIPVARSSDDRLLAAAQDFYPPGG